MYKFEMLGEKVNDKVSLDSREFNRMLNLLEDGKLLFTVEVQREPKTIEEYRAEYFAKRDIVADATGNSKKDIHEEAKGYILDGMSTTKLDIEGWQIFLRKFKDWSFEFFNVYL